MCSKKSSKLIRISLDVFGDLDHYRNLEHQGFYLLKSPSGIKEKLQIECAIDEIENRMLKKAIEHIEQDLNATSAYVTVDDVMKLFSRPSEEEEETTTTVVALTSFNEIHVPVNKDEHRLRAKASNQMNVKVLQACPDRETWFGSKNPAALPVCLEDDEFLLQTISVFSPSENNDDVVSSSVLDEIFANDNTHYNSNKNNI